MTLGGIGLKPNNLDSTSPQRYVYSKETARLCIY